MFRKSITGLKLGHYVISGAYQETDNVDESADHVSIKGFVSRKDALDYIEQHKLHLMEIVERDLFVNESFLPEIEDSLAKIVLGIPVNFGV